MARESNVNKLILFHQDLGHDDEVLNHILNDARQQSRILTSLRKDVSLIFDVCCKISVFTQCCAVVIKRKTSGLATGSYLYHTQLEFSLALLRRMHVKLWS